MYKKLFQEDIINDVIKLLLSYGFQKAGKTKTQNVIIPTQKVPVYGQSGGELATFGGRTKLKKKDQYVTIGKKTTNFYKVKKIHPIHGPELYDFYQFKTNNIKDIEKFLREKNV